MDVVFDLGALATARKLQLAVEELDLGIRAVFLGKQIREFAWPNDVFEAGAREQE